MRIDRVFTVEGQSAYENISFRNVSSEIRNPDGSVVFKQDNIEVPERWSQVASDVLAQKYFRKAGDLPPPESFSLPPRSAEKFEPVPEPYLNKRASRTQRSMMPPSLTRSSLMPWMKQACGCGCSYELAEAVSSPVQWST